MFFLLYLNQVTVKCCLLCYYSIRLTVFILGHVMAKCSLRSFAVLKLLLTIFPVSQHCVQSHEPERRSKINLKKKSCGHFNPLSTFSQLLEGGWGGGLAIRVCLHANPAGGKYMPYWIEEAHFL